LIPDLKQKLKTYVEDFNRLDEELYPQAVPNRGAYDFLAGQIPLLECPDRQLEETYYFRWWTFRKHLKETPHGHIVTEFLPTVKWAGPFNSINCSACFHLREGRWLVDPDGWMKEYIAFWLDGHGDAMSYSAWLASAVEEYCTLRGDQAFGAACLDALIDLYRRWEEKALQPSGLFWSDDDRDAMEFSISGPGLRPTLNSYMYGDAMAIARMARSAGRAGVAEAFERKARDLKERIQRLIWDGDFFKGIPCAKGAQIATEQRPEVPPDHDVRELVGYIPWYFNLPDAGYEKGFAHLRDERGFRAPFGLTTAERRHPRFMFENPHECLWNGPVWPFATSQTLVAAANLLRNYHQTALAKEDYLAMLRQYAVSHRRVDASGNMLHWIDENMHPFTGEWLARGILEKWGWLPETGGYERGKDYNHSLFCDLVLSGLLGIGPDGCGSLTADPLILEEWDYFCVSGVRYKGQDYAIFYDRTGERYGEGRGVTIRKLSVCI
jgi:hypothetical protein